MERSAVREKFDIEGCADDDFINSCCFPCRTIVQNEAEILSRTKGDKLSSIGRLTVTIEEKPELEQRPEQHKPMAMPRTLTSHPKPVDNCGRGSWLSPKGRSRGSGTVSVHIRGD
jgi:hypothetical protein